LKNAQIVVNPGDTEKMSDVILRFAEPLLDGADGSVEKNVIRFAIGVWNASLLPPPAQAEALKSIVAILPEGDIVDYQITQSRDMLHLDVVSTLGKDYHPDT
jgi:hypothetical protein